MTTDASDPQGRVEPLVGQRKLFEAAMRAKYGDSVDALCGTSTDGTYCWPQIQDEWEQWGTHN